MEKVILAVIDKSLFSPRIIYIEIMANKGMNSDDVLNAIEKSCREFYETPTGKEAVSDYRDFGYHEFDCYVPNSICEKYGISKIAKESHVIEVENEILVKKELDSLELEEEEYEK